MTTGLPDFFRYHLWANLRLLDACAQLTAAQLDATMEHLAVCETPSSICWPLKKAIRGQ